MPTFSNMGKNLATWYSDVVPENIELHSPLSVQIQASSPMSRKLIYSIVKGNEMEEFTVDFNTGMLRLLLTLYFRRRFFVAIISLSIYFTPATLRSAENFALPKIFHPADISIQRGITPSCADCYIDFPYPIPLWLILRHSYSFAVHCLIEHDKLDRFIQVLLLQAVSGGGKLLRSADSPSISSPRLWLGLHRSGASQTNNSLKRLVSDDSDFSEGKKKSQPLRLVADDEGKTKPGWVSGK